MLQGFYTEIAKIETEASDTHHPPCGSLGWDITPCSASCRMERQYGGCHEGLTLMST